MALSVALVWQLVMYSISARRLFAASRVFMCPLCNCSTLRVRVESLQLFKCCSAEVPAILRFFLNCISLWVIVPPAGYSAHYLCVWKHWSHLASAACCISYFFLFSPPFLTHAGSICWNFSQSVCQQPIERNQIIGSKKKSNIFLSPLAVFDISGSQKQKGVAGKAAKSR